ncbi:MFS transporter [Dyella sp.]|jgi:MFS family permease|uniref:MFS transporter n=1 Tax=Dyella sp. TaxID=1869338 RepID=UPI002FDB5419
MQELHPKGGESASSAIDGGTGLSDSQGHARAALSQTSPARMLLSMGAVIATATIFGLSYSLSAPLIAVSLAARGYSDRFIGINAAMHAVGVLAIAPCMPALAGRLGARRVAILALVVTALTLAAFPFVTAVGWWFPLRVLLGAAAEALFVMSETWANSLSADEARGRTMAMYTASLSLGMVLGPATLAWLGINRDGYFLAGCLSLFAVAFIAGRWVVAPASIRPESAHPMTYVRMAPVAMATTALNAGVETAGLSFIGLYAAAQGWTNDQAMRLISTLMFGAIVLQLPIGWLADRFPKRKLAMVLAWISAAGALCWPFVLGHALLAFGIVFCWGGVFVGIYTVMLAMVGERFAGASLVGIYAVMGLAWGAGALAGPTLAGLSMGASARFGFPALISLACAGFAVFLSRSRSAG